MNYTDFSITGGFPLNQARLSFLQSAWVSGFEALGKFIGGAGIVVLTGCDENAGVTQDGWIVINGEILPFIGGTTGTFIEVIEASFPIVGLVYENQANNTSSTQYPQRNRFAQFAATGIAWSPIRFAQPIANILSLNTDWVHIGITPGAPALYAGWSLNNSLRYRTDMASNCHIQGQLAFSAATLPYSSVVLTLPLGFRPTIQIRVPVFRYGTTYQSGATGTAAEENGNTGGLIINTNGDVAFEIAGIDSTTISLNIIFSIS